MKRAEPEREARLTVHRSRPYARISDTVARQRWWRYRQYTASCDWLLRPKILPNGLESFSTRTTRYRWRSIGPQAEPSATSSEPRSRANSAPCRSPSRTRSRALPSRQGRRAHSSDGSWTPVSFFERVLNLITITRRSASSPVSIWPGPSSAPLPPPRSATMRSSCNSCSRGCRGGSGASSPRDTNSSRERWTRIRVRSATRGARINRTTSRCARGWAGPALVESCPRSGTGSASGPRSMAVPSGAGRRSSPRNDRDSPPRSAPTTSARSRTASRDVTCRRSS